MAGTVFHTSGTWTCPLDYGGGSGSCLRVKCWGAGAGGSGASYSVITPENKVGHGGGGGAYSESMVKVTAGQTYTYTVGTGGAAPPIRVLANGLDGTATSFQGDAGSENLVLADGGYGTGVGGLVAAGSGSIKYAGGGGGDGIVGTELKGGGGGSGGGTAGDGSGAGYINGVAALTGEFGGTDTYGGGTGGRGAQTIGLVAIASTPGGDCCGGGGGVESATVNGAAAPGGNGRIELEWVSCPDERTLTPGQRMDRIRRNRIRARDPSRVILNTNAEQFYRATCVWQCPVGVTSARVICYGAGGNGGRAFPYAQESEDHGGCGGGGGAYAAGTVTVIPGELYDVIVGVPNTAHTESSFSLTGTPLVKAEGGHNGADSENNSTVGAGGLAANSVGTTKFSGGSGGQSGRLVDPANPGPGVFPGGGGGAAAGPGGNGNVGHDATADTTGNGGAGLPPGEGDGGDGSGPNGNVGGRGVQPGGGGGGAGGGATAANIAGGTGAIGLVTIYCRC